MRKLKVQMNIALDNKWDSGMSKFSIENLKKVDCILHGRKTAEGFIPYWAEVATNPDESEYELGRLLTGIPNAVFSNTVQDSEWENATIINGEIKEGIEDLKSKEGGDIIVYGGESFVSSLIQHDLIDELYLLVNPVAIGNGQQTFNPLKSDLHLTLERSEPFACGVVLLYYGRKK
ncbi:MAG TPA: dihydrofolate reductase family protein [Flavitalea sp.]|nr:dihydrofolate reductase family protein [Flavitalea sp.]